MNSKYFFAKLNKLVEPGRKDIVEKDFHLHRLLSRISRDEYLKENFVFKGGTCLIKAYTGYYRFSEDIDLTWKHEEEWKDLSANQTRKRCSEEIDTFMNRLDQISQELGLDFKPKKSDNRYVDIGGGGRMPTFFLRYHSDTMDIPSMIKIEVNFVDKTLYPYMEKELNSLVEFIDADELPFLFEECWNEYTRPVTMECYEPKEIYTDKCRALLTRIAYKMRDCIDLYMLEDRYRYTVKDLKNDIKVKTDFMLKLYEKYRENLRNNLPSPEQLSSEETRLVIKPLPKDWGKELSQTHEGIERIGEDLMEDKESGW